MDPASIGLIVLSAVLGLAAAILSRRLSAARRAIRELETRPAPKTPPRIFEGRRERFGLLWFPTLSIDEERKLVTAVSPGLPHCARCVRPLALAAGPSGEWTCAGCGDKRAGTAADLQVTDGVVSETLKEFLARNPSHRLK